MRRDSRIKVVALPHHGSTFQRSSSCSSQKGGTSSQSVADRVYNYWLSGSIGSPPTYFLMFNEAQQNFFSNVYVGAGSGCVEAPALFG